MIDEDHIIKKYIEANCEHRLTLYLNHPPLRNRFVNIDLNEKGKPGGKRKREMFLKSFFGLNRQELQQVNTEQ